MTTDKDAKTFQALLKINAHKESKLRRKISIMEERTVAIDEKKIAHTHERHHVWSQMRTETLADISVKSKELDPYQAHFRHLYLKDRDLLEKIDQLVQEKSELIEAQASLSEHLQKVANKQEKIKAFLDEY